MDRFGYRILGQVIEPLREGAGKAFGMCCTIMMPGNRAASASGIP